MKTSTKAILILSVLLCIAVVLLILKYTSKPEIETTIEYIEVIKTDSAKFNKLQLKFDSLNKAYYELVSLKPPIHTIYIEKPIYIPGKDSIIVLDSLPCNVLNTYQDTLSDSNSVEIYRITTLGYLMEYQRDLKINYPIITNTIIEKKRFYEKAWFWGCVGFGTGFYLGNR